MNMDAHGTDIHYRILRQECRYLVAALCRNLSDERRIGPSLSRCQCSIALQKEDVERDQKVKRKRKEEKAQRECLMVGAVICRAFCQMAAN